MNHNTLTQSAATHPINRTRAAELPIQESKQNSAIRRSRSPALGLHSETLLENHKKRRVGANLYSTNIHHNAEPIDAAHSPGSLSLFPTQIPEQDVLNSIKNMSPALHQQIICLENHGWQIKVGKLSTKNVYLDRPNKEIVIDPYVQANSIMPMNSFSFGQTSTSLFTKDPYSYLFSLAYEVGHASDTQPISIESREEFIESHLNREMHGIKNAFKIRDEILHLYGKDIWKNRLDKHAPIDFEKINYAKFSENKFLKKLGRIKASINSPTYADLYSQAYDFFEISTAFSLTNPALIKYAQDCFNKTGIILKPQQMQLCAHDQNDNFIWLTKDQARVIEFNRSEEFIKIGIQNTKDIYNLVSVACKSGMRSSISNENNNWHRYNFCYEDTMLELHIQRDEKSGQILDLHVPEQPYSIPERKRLQDVLTGEGGATIKQWAALAGMAPHAFLIKIMQTKNHCRHSLEHSLCSEDAWRSADPRFEVYRNKNKNDKYTFTIAGKIENGQIIAATPGTKLDHLFMSFSRLEKAYAKLEKEGWTIRLSPHEEAYCSRNEKEIAIGASYLSNAALLPALAHEIAHAQYNERDTHSLEEYIKDNKLDEGNSLFSEFSLIDQARDKKSKKMIINMLKEESTSAEFNENYSIFKKWKSGEITQNSAIEEFGNIYSNYYPSGYPENINYATLWKTSYEIDTPEGVQNKVKLLTELKETRPSLQFSNKESALNQEVHFIYRLPINGKIIFIDLNTFEKAVKNRDSEPLFDLIRNGVHYGDMTVRPGIEPYIRIAESTFHQDGLYYKIEYEFKDSGHVFDLRIQSSKAPFQALGSISMLNNPRSSSAQATLSPSP
ncbi:hypothetical protein [Mycoavidus sp. B2-EB]|uniref:hypothetical protein n=1 Tax=Mycoavidus sp. B2-EB TaxID=2651972 RepID=UPI00162631B8|nr:hypothetical protein [Mycoavidus sp. B2-EB]BBO59551.1 hypothetical protein MPB2EB_0672 [Mycoavidus sp. B2-EB]